ncbi:MAG: hypothetical protein LBC90_02515 [Candidatus Adiutrix sp.]|jgi:hypothetical protein|nr:hypothetical protein [Candidatus Adiutrix sp.]
MRALMLDELTPREVAAARAYLLDQAEFSGVEGLYWLQLPPDLWSDHQKQAQASGLPGTESYRLAVETGPKWVRFELLVRAETLANPGSAQATTEQALYILGWADRMARELGLITCVDPSSGKTADPAESAAEEEEGDG